MPASVPSTAPSAAGMDPSAPSESPATPPPAPMPTPATEKLPSAPPRRRQGKVVLPAATEAVASPPVLAAAAGTLPAPSAAPGLPPIQPDAARKRRRGPTKPKDGAAARKKTASPSPPPPPPPAPPVVEPTLTPPPPPPPAPTSAPSDAADPAREVLDTMPTSGQTPDEMREFMSALLDDSHVIGLEDIAFSLADDSQEVPSESPEVEEVEPHIMKKKQTTSANYKVEEDEALCYAWMNVSLNATVGADQSKETFWRRIEEYYSHNVKISSNRTQGSLAHRWSIIQDCCNWWAGCVEQLNNAPPSGVPITEYDMYIQELYKQKNKRNGNKKFTLLHCYAILKGNEKWARRNYETTPKRSRLSISSSIDLEDGEDDERGRSPTPSLRPDGRKQEKERKKNGGVGAYKEEFKKMIQTKRELALERKQEKMARWMELKEIEEERLRVKARAEARLLEI